MNDTGIASSRMGRQKVRRRLGVMLGGLSVLLVVHVVATVMPGRSDDGDPERPLDSCLTEQAVLEFLDGKTVGYFDPTDTSGAGIHSITLRKQNISSLSLHARDSIEVGFNLDHEGKTYRVQGSFSLWNHDSAECHYHSWGPFLGLVVPGRSGE